MLNKLYATVSRHPKTIIIAVLAITLYFALQLPHLRWETDARVYLPKGHKAILYDERVDEWFGVKDAVIIGIVNDEKSIFNPETLARIDRITRQIAALPGVVAQRPIDIASLSTATVFVGTDDELVAQPLMPRVPQGDEAIQQLKQRIYDHPELFVGNLVSADGSAAMIRAKLKEGQANRYMTYWQIKTLLDKERGVTPAWSGGGGDWAQQQWPDEGTTTAAADLAAPEGWTGEVFTLDEAATAAATPAAPAPDAAASGQWSEADRQSWWQGQAAAAGDDNGDRFYLAGRPVIEVTAGQHAMADMQVMIPLLVLAIAATLFALFRTWRGVLLPLFVMGAAIIWTFGAMAVLNVPLYTISTMLPVILVAVGIGDAVHLMSHYYDHVLHEPGRPAPELVQDVMGRLGAPLVTTSLTTAAGFMSLYFAEMPPFVVFGVFTVVGIAVSWLLSVTFLPAVLGLLRPKVGGYLAKRRALRVYSEQNRLSRFLVAAAAALHQRRTLATTGLAALVLLGALGSSKLYVDSSWMNDFRPDSDLVKANTLLNERFDGTIFLNVVIEGQRPDTFKSPALLRRIAAMQENIADLPYVGNSRSIVDYIKSLNRSLHADDPAYSVLPESKGEIAEILFLLSVSGRPDQLDEMIDYDYRRALVTFSIKTDHTQDLKRIIDATRDFSQHNFADFDVDVNLAGSANNSYVWADLLIDSQTLAIVLSKVGIFLLALLLFRSAKIALFTIVPVTLTTLLIAGFAGLAGIALDVSTALAAGVAIGVGVDYAVHYIFRYRAEKRRGLDDLAATQATLRSVGKTIVFNAAVVTIGFAVLWLSQFPPHVKLGYFVVAYMVLSCVIALLTLPVLFQYHRRRAMTEVAVSAT